MGMSSKTNRMWSPAGIFTGVFDDHVVMANRHQSSEGDTAWHVTVYRNSGDTSHREYWIEDEHFMATLGTSVNLNGEMSIDTGDEVEELDPREQAAIIQAINHWKNKD